ncbi:MAG: hypothetical protein Q8R13_02045 [bacterium]|nr:hypothetical protein [bacterium]MDZ4296022.1 hypothetical protein [Patescibacteria group bacterium]
MTGHRGRPPRTTVKKKLISMRVRRSTLRKLRRIADETGEYIWGLMRRLAEAEKYGPLPSRSPSPRIERLSTIWVKPATRETIYTRIKETGEPILTLIGRLARQELERQRCIQILSEIAKK